MPTTFLLPNTYCCTGITIHTTCISKKERRIIVLTKSKANPSVWGPFVESQDVYKRQLLLRARGPVGQLLHPGLPCRRQLCGELPDHVRYADTVPRNHRLPDDGAEEQSDNRQAGHAWRSLGDGSHRDL